MKGVIAFITTNATTHTSGTVFTESILNGLLQLCWNNGNGEVPDEIYVGGNMRRKISSFTANATKFIQADDRRLINTVDIYVSDFGVHKIFLHRYVNIATDSTARIVGIKNEKFRIAYLQGRTPKIQQLAKTGDADYSQVIGELTLECLNEKVNFFSDGFLNAA